MKAFKPVSLKPIETAKKIKEKIKKRKSQIIILNSPIAIPRFLANELTVVTLPVKTFS